MKPWLASLALVALQATWLDASSALAACSGPCATPEIWNVEVTGDELTAITNFGLLSQQDGKWQMICEETTPGLFLKAQLSSDARYVSTSMGLVFQQQAGCDFQLVETSADERAWLVDFVLPEQTQGPEAPTFGVLFNQGEDQLQVLRGHATSSYESLVSFPIDDGYDSLVALGDPASLFLSGYSFNPRTFRLAYSLGGGDNWTAVVPEVDTEQSTFKPIRVNPTQPSQLFLNKRTPTDQADELWLFDAQTESMRQLLVFDGTASLTGSALLDEGLYLAGVEFTGGSATGSLYFGSLDDLQFEQLLDDGPGFRCLHGNSGLLYTCNNDFTRDSEFLLASSADQGQTWDPLLELETLGTMPSCDRQACKATLDWMHATFGVLSADAGNAQPPAGADAGPTGVDRDAGVAAPREPDEGNPAGNHNAKAAGCGCRLTTSKHGSFPPSLAVALASCWLFLKRWRHFASRAPRSALRRLLLASLCVILSGCGDDPDEPEQGDSESDPPDSEEADELNEAELQELKETASASDCRERDDELNDLEVKGSNGASMTLLQVDPMPPSVGNNAFTVELQHEDEPIESAANQILVTPHMPDHGHGSPVAVGVEETKSGRYELSPVNTFMPGFWQITVELDSEALQTAFQFGICVQ